MRTAPSSRPVPAPPWQARAVTSADEQAGPRLGPGGRPGPDGAAPTAALAAELARRTAVSWVRHGGRTRPVWHAWSEGALCLVTGGEEQPALDVPDGDEVDVLMRSADTGGLALTWTGRAQVVRPDDPRWAATTAALVAARLNLRDPAGAPDRWARSGVVHRVTPVEPG